MAAFSKINFRAALTFLAAVLLFTAAAFPLWGLGGAKGQKPQCRCEASGPVFTAPCACGGENCLCPKQTVPLPPPLVPFPAEAADLSVHFLELGNRYTGDCVFVDYGDTEIIIDAGSKPQSAAVIQAYINNHISDGTLEYVIATHAHEDHIAGFYGNEENPGILDSYTIGTIIDFPKTNSASAAFKNYLQARNRAVEKGAARYSALECFNNEGKARRIYDLGGNVTLEILYNYYYEHYTASENNYSVCVKIINGKNHYLFTGDLEKTGEDRLVDFYETFSGGLGHCVLYKGGHHGSKTSAGEKLMAAITPEYVCICSCAGSSQYRAAPANTFPAQAFINRVAPYTDRVYVTTLVTHFSANVFEPMNGSIVFRIAAGTPEVQCENNNLVLKDTDWFKNNRTTPAAWKMGNQYNMIPDY